MAHAFARFHRKALADHFIVGEKRSVEENAFSGANSVGKRRVNLRAARNIKERVAGLRVGDL